VAPKGEEKEGGRKSKQAVFKKDQEGQGGEVIPGPTTRKNAADKEKKLRERKARGEGGTPLMVLPQPGPK